MIIKTFTIAHVSSFVTIITAMIIGKIVKGRYQMGQDSAANETVNVPLYQYILILPVGVVGMLIYYFVNANL